MTRDALYWTCSNDPARPLEFEGSNGIDRYHGFTQREQAAILLRVPDSGLAWLDDFIREAIQREFVLANQCHIAPKQAVVEAGIRRADEFSNLAAIRRVDGEGDKSPDAASAG